MTFLLKITLSEGLSPRPGPVVTESRRLPTDKSSQRVVKRVLGFLILGTILRKRT